MTILAELRPFDRASNTRATVRVMSRQDTDAGKHNDQRWFPAIFRSPSIGLQTFRGDFEQNPALATGDMVLSDTAIETAYPGADHFLYAKAPITLWKYSDGTASEIFSGVVENFTRQQGKTTLNLSVSDEEFAADILTLQYAGTGGLEGEANLKGVAKPWVHGRVRFMEPVPLDLIDNVFQVSAYGPVDAIEGVYEGGASFGASQGDYADLAALLAADLAGGQWATCLALGLFRLGAPPAGVITADVRGDSTGGYRDLTGAIIARIADHLGLSARVKLTDLAALDAAMPYPVGFVVANQEQFLSLVQRIVLMCNALAGVDMLGKLFVTRPVIGAPVITLDANAGQMPPVKSMDEESVAAPYSTVLLGAEKCWRVHSFAEVKFSARLEEVGLWDADGFYIEGQIVSTAGGSRYLYVATEPGSAAEPGTDNSVWRLLSTSSTLTPRGDYDNAATYDPGDIIVWTDGSSYARIGTGETTGIDPSDGTKWAHFLNGADDVVTEDGFFLRRVYRTSETQPATPTGDGVPVGWQDDPTVQPRWMSEVKQYFDFTLVEGEAWSVPREDGHKGEKGDDGFSRATIQIYIRSDTQPALPSNVLTYNFQTNTLSGLNNNWSRAITADNGQPLWTTLLDFYGQGATDTVQPANIPPAIGLPGGGADAPAFVPVTLHKRAPENAPPAVPSGNVVVNLSTAAVSGALDGWTVAIPSGAGDPVYRIHATAFGLGISDEIPPSEWEPPIIVFRDGEDGDDGADGNDGTDGTDGEDAITVSPPSAAFTVAASASGVVKTGKLPISITFKVLKGTADITGTASFSFTPTDCSAALSGTNNRTLNITGLAADTAKVVVTVTVAGTVVATPEISLTKARDGAAATSASDQTIGAPTSGSYGAVHGGPIAVLTGVDGTVTFDAFAAIRTAAKTGTTAGKIQYRTGNDGSTWSSWADVASETLSSPEGQFEPGILEISHTLGHSGPATFYQARLLLRIGSGGAPTSVNGNLGIKWS